MASQNEFTDTEQSVNDAELDEVERKLGFTFPLQIREHYAIYNGGCPERYLFKKEDRVYVVQEFLSVKFGVQGNLLENAFRDLKVEQEILPTNLVPFAIDPAGDFYCFSVADDEAGEIFFFNGEYSDNPERAVQHIANSLQQFIQEMVEDE